MKRTFWTVVTALALAPFLAAWLACGAVLAVPVEGVPDPRPGAAAVAVA